MQRGWIQIYPVPCSNTLIQLGLQINRKVIMDSASCVNSSSMSQTKTCSEFSIPMLWGSLTPCSPHCVKKRKLCFPLTQVGPRPGNEATSAPKACRATAKSRELDPCVPSLVSPLSHGEGEGLGVTSYVIRQASFRGSSIDLFSSS